MYVPKDDILVFYILQTLVMNTKKACPAIRKIDRPTYHGVRSVLFRGAEVSCFIIFSPALVRKSSGFARILYFFLGPKIAI